MKLSARSALTLLLWLAALRTLAAGLAINIEGTAVDGYFPVVIVGFLLGWAGESLNANLTNARMKKEKFASFASSRHSRSRFYRESLTWVLILLLGAAFAFLHNGRLTQPLGNFARAGLRYQWQKIESRSTRVAPDPRAMQSAQTNLTRQWSEVNRRLAAWLQNLRAGQEAADPMALQIAWSLPALALASWAGWNLRRRGRALTALLPSTLLLAYLQYYSQPDALNFLLHLLILLMLIALAEGAAPLRDSVPARGLSSDALMGTFLASVAIIVIAGIAPSISAAKIAQTAAGDLRERARQEQNDSAAKALGLESGPSGRAPGQYAEPGLPREHLLQGAPQLSRAVVFTVRTGDLPPMERVPRDEQPPRYYWRTITYDAYTGHGWAITLNESRDEAAGAFLIDALPTGYRLLDLDLTLLAPSRLAWTGQLARANRPLHTAWRSLPDSREFSLDPLRGADLIAAASDASAFHLESLLPTFTVAQLRAASMEYPDWVRAQYLPLPSDLPARVRDLAADLTANQPSAYERAIAIELYLRHFPYTLDVPIPPADRDVADYFLFDLQTGYCDYYATAMVVLARAAGLPARLVSGYASGEYIPSEAYYRVRESDAHSWVEIYFTDLGWVEFEPTANRPLIARSEEQFTQTGYAFLPEEDSAANENPALKFVRNMFALPWVSLLAGVLSVALAGFVTVAIRERIQLNAPVKTISAIYKQVYRMGRKWAGETGRVHTPFTFARALAKRLEILPRSKFLRNLLAPAPAELTALTDLYVRAIYSPVPPTREETIRAMQIWRKLFWRLWGMRIGIQNSEF